MSSGVTGKLSSRIMNMKFMRFSAAREDSSEAPVQQQEAEQSFNKASKTESTVLHDNSEWFGIEANKSGELRKKKVVKLGRLTKKAAVVQSLGFTALRINEGSSPSIVNTGRRLHGDTESKLADGQDVIKKEEGVTQKDKSRDGSGNDDDGDDDDDYELDKIFRDNMKKRRLEGGNSSNGKSKTTKKGKSKNTNKRQKKNNRQK